MSNQFLKLRRSAVPGRVPSTSSIDFGEIALNTYDGLAFIKRSGSLGEEVITLGSREGAFTGSFSGSFIGNGGGLFNISASAIVGLNLSQIATGSVSASVGVDAASFNVVSASNSLLYVSSSGNIGIATNTPSYKLTVAGSGTVAAFAGNGTAATAIQVGGGELGTLFIENQTNGGGAGINIYTQRGNSSFNIGYRTTSGANGGPINIGNLSSYAAGNINFLQNGATKVIIDISGNVGINTTSPTAKLDVSGSSRFTGNMTVTGSSYFLGPSDNVAFTIRSGTASSAYLLADIQMSGGASAFTIANNGAINAYSSITYGGQTIVNNEGIVFRNATPVEIGRISQTNSETGGATNGYTSNQSRKFTFSHGIYSSGGNTILGPLFADLGDRLQVTGSSRFIGNMVITGSGNTSATNALTIQNSVGVNAIRVRNDGSTILGQTTVHTANAPNSAQVDTIFVNSLRGSDGASGLYVNGGSSFSIFSFQASNNGAYLSLSGQYPLYLTQTRYGINIVDTLNADAITATYTGLNISSVVNQVSGASGIIRGIRISPTLNSAWDYRSIEWTNNASATSGSWGLYGSGTAPNYLSGSLNIGTTTLGPNILNVNGTTSLNGNTTITGSLTVSNTITAQTLVVQTITSSTDYVSGSTIFGNSLSNTHQFTGSVSITGSLRVNGGTVPLGSGVAGQVTVWSGSSSISGSNGLFWDATNSRLGIGTDAPTTTLTVSGGLTLSSGILSLPTAIHSVFSGAYRFWLQGTNRWAFDALGGNLGYQFKHTMASGNAFNIIDASNVSQFLVNSVGNIIINSTSDSGNRLQVYGTTFLSGSVTGSDMLIRGSGNTSATNALTIQNSSTTNIIAVKNNRTTNIISDAGQLNIASSADGTNGIIEADVNSSNTQTVFVQLTRGTVGFASTAINQTAVRINGGFAPTSGTATWNSLHINPTINQTGGANGITRGLYIQPSLTANADFRAIEWSNSVSGSTSWGLYGTGNALNYISGRVGIGASLPSNTTYLSVTGQITGGVISYGVFQSGFVRSDVTIYGVGIANRLNKSDSNTLPDYYNFAALGGGSISGAVTNEYGFIVGSGMTSATSSYGFYGDLASGTGRWNLYMNGTANNYLAGNLGIGTTSPAVSLEVRNSTIGELAYFRNNASNAGIVIGNITNVGYVSSVSSLSGLGFGINGGTTAIRIFTNSNVAINSAVNLGATFGVAGNTFISGTLDILDAEINYQRNNNVTTGSARLIASIPTASYNAAFFDYVIVSGSNARAGTVMSVWASSSVEWNETYTNDIGSTTDVSLYAAITGSSIGLFATSSINNIWTIKSLIRTI